MHIIPYTYKKYLVKVDSICIVPCVDARVSSMGIVPYVYSNNTTAMNFYIKPLTALVCYVPPCLSNLQLEHIKYRDTVYLSLITQFNGLIDHINALFRESKGIRNLPDDDIIFKVIDLYLKISSNMSVVYSNFYPIIFKDMLEKSSSSKDIKDKYFNIIITILAVDHKISYILGDLLRMKKEMISPPKIRSQGRNGSKYYSSVLDWC
uniref:hypothetical protein n=1 Tax=Exserohilum turcicum TaxID=93612 RepID=UPI0020013743|nr:hypothetical protein M1I11_mgp145 [Exserohilum turcicum]UOU81336.1 hypothetical protein [Exserohilum turcicum]